MAGVQRRTEEGDPDSQSPARGPRLFRFDAIQRLASSCPCWIVIPSYDCRDYVPTMQLMDSSRLVEMFASKTLSRSTCLAGLLNSTKPLLANMSHVPAAFFRSLEYLLELRDAGAFYRPITPEDLTAGAPAPHWCLPLHMQLQQQTSPHGPLQLRSQQHATLEALAHAALSTAPYWCLVHKCHLNDAKCDFNWAPRDLVAGLVSRSVSPYTLVLGLNMHKERSMPWMRSCLFMPLAAVLHQHQSGITYVPLGPDDLHLSNTLGYKGSLAAMLQRGSVPQPPADEDVSGAGPSGGGASSAPQRGTLATEGRPVPVVADEQQAALGRTSEGIQSHASGPGVTSLGLTGFDMAPRTTSAQQGEGSQTWTTPLFHLLFANAPGLPAMGPPQSWWWLLDSSQQVLQGPFNAEQLLIGYCRGLVLDSTLVCGTTQGSASGQGGAQQPPSLSCFRPLHTLLAAVQQGGAYSLVQAVTGPVNQNLVRPALTSLPSHQLVSRTQSWTAGSGSSQSVRESPVFVVPHRLVQTAPAPWFGVGTDEASSHHAVGNVAMIGDTQFASHPGRPGVASITDALSMQLSWMSMQQQMGQLELQQAQQAQQQPPPDL